jgi:hypothetical protein
MPTRRDTLYLNQRLMETAETRAARAIAAAYNQARRELLTALLDGWLPGRVIRPQDQAALLRQLGLLAQIDARIAQLEQETGVILRGVIESGTERAYAAIQREIAQLPPDLRPTMGIFNRINEPMVERFLPLAVDDVTDLASTIRTGLKRELQTGLLQGQSFPDLTRRLFSSTEPGVWRNGTTSAERLTRRLVIHSENAARVELIGQAAQRIPGVQKQAVAVMSPETTDCCLRVHGQIVDVDQPFQLDGEPRFADDMLHTPFHWNCRTSIVMYHPSFERGGLTTSNMRKSAEAEQRKRTK